MKKPSATYSVKKLKDGDYEVTLHNQTKVFNLKEVVMSFLDAQKMLKEVTSQRSLNKAILQNIKDYHGDVIKMFEKLPKVKRAALANYLTISESIAKDDLKHRDANTRFKRLEKELADIRNVIPADDKELTKSEKRRIDQLKKSK